MKLGVKMGILQEKEERQFILLYSYPTSFDQEPVLVIFVLKFSLFKNFHLLLHFQKCLSVLE